jgi:prepilin-type N-terminal cleavage/methylation domain-containing protein
MRSPHSRLLTARFSIPRSTASSGSSRTLGFSMIELLVTLVLAGIIFAAMVPFFANALKATARDQDRNVATNIARDRIEQVRLLDYQDVTQANLTAPPVGLGDGKFGSSYAVAGGGVYDVTYAVSPSASPDAPRKTVVVSVTKPLSSHTTTMKTVVKNAAPGVSTNVSTAPSPSPTITGLSITVYFKDWNHVKGSSYGVWIVRASGTPTPTSTVTLSPTLRPSSSATPYVKWTNLTGGTVFTYTVTCHGSNTTSTSPKFHLLKDARLKFDTNPGGS